MVEHQVKVVTFTTHTDCAMEAVAHSDHADHFPALSKALLEREQTYLKFLARPAIAERIAAKKLIVKRFRIDTETSKLLPEGTEVDTPEAANPGEAPTVH